MGRRMRAGGRGGRRKEERGLQDGVKEEREKAAREGGAQGRLGERAMVELV